MALLGWSFGAWEVLVFGGVAAIVATVVYVLWSLFTRGDKE